LSDVTDMAFKDHLENTLRINPEPTPLFKMILSALAITTPLIFGYINHQIFASMIGALIGLVIYLNDHFGPLKTRFIHLITIFFLFMLSFYVGALCVGNNYIIVGVLFICSFLVGKSKDFGIELERMMLFITLQFLTASSDPVFYTQINSLIVYSIITFINYILWSTLIFYVSKHQVTPMISKRETVKHIMKNNKSSYFPLVCAVFSCVGFMAAQFFQFSHANWIVGTALIVILPDSYQSIYKSTQRLLGTTAGVLIASLILTYVHDPKLLIAFVFIFSFLMPNGISKNYWVANIYIAALILLFLEIAAPQSIASHHLAYWRIVDIALGSFIGVLAAIWLKPELITSSTKTIK
jgi:hypothetical protein